MTNIIILGGGSSILDGLREIDLQNIFKEQLVIGCNSAFIDFETTATCCLDEKFISEYKNELENEIVITQNQNIERYLKSYFIKNAYSSHLGLTGIYALSLFNSLYKNANIFLLGFDFTKGNFHERNKSDKDIYDLSKQEIENIFKQIPLHNNIYNVNTDSKIPNYVKISYQNFLSFLTTKKPQKELKENLKKLLLNSL